jgi:quinol monooxygenase YgiN
LSITVIATITPLAEHKDAVRAAFVEAIPKVHAEEGCELYSLHEAQDRLVLVEQWSSREALDVHLKAPALAELGPRLVGKVAGASDVVILDPVLAGQESKGRIRP